MDSNNKNPPTAQKRPRKGCWGFFYPSPNQKNHTSTGGFGQTSSPQMRRPFSEEPSRGTNGALVLWDPKIWKKWKTGWSNSFIFQGSNITTLRLKKWRWTYCLTQRYKKEQLIFWFDAQQTGRKWFACVVHIFCVEKERGSDFRQV